MINAAARVNDLSAESNPWKLDVMVKKSDVSLKRAEVVCMRRWKQTQPNYVKEKSPLQSHVLKLR